MTWLDIPVEDLRWDQIPEEWQAGGRAVALLVLRDLPYHEYLQTEHWDRIRRTTLKRCGYKCVICLASKALDVHHVTYEHLGYEEPLDTIALCREHHNLQHELLRHVMHARFEEF